MLERMQREGIFLHCWWECKLYSHYGEQYGDFFKKTNKQTKKLVIEPPYDPIIPRLGIYPEETIIEKDTHAPIFIITLFTIARTWKQPRCSLTDK